MSIKLLIKSLLRRKVVTVLLFLQLAMTLALLVNATLLAQQAHQLLNQDTGLPLDEVLAVRIKPSARALRAQPALQDLMDRQMTAIRQMSGVQAVAFANQAPLQMGGSNGNVNDSDHPETNNVDTVPANYVSADYLKVLGVKVLAGEWPAMPTAFDPNAQLGVVLTESLARKVFGEGSAIGKQTNRGRVAAVVSDYHSQRFASALPYNSILVTPMPTGDWGYVMLIRVNAEQLLAVQQALPAVLQQVDANIEIQDSKSLSERRANLYGNEHGLSVLLSLLAGLMLVVAMVSSYSNAYFHALKMQQEIGIKRALGASRHAILLELLSENWLTTLVGTSLGLLAAYGLNQALALVISVPSLPVWLVGVAILALLVCVTIATWYPARIATQISPATATKTL